MHLVQHGEALQGPEGQQRVRQKGEILMILEIENHEMCLAVDQFSRKKFPVGRLATYWIFRRRSVAMTGTCPCEMILRNLRNLRLTGPSDGKSRGYRAAGFVTCSTDE